MPKKRTDPVVSEAHIQQTCTQMLELDGWRALRTDPVSDRGRGKGFGEKGMADHLYIRYCSSPYEIHMDGVDPDNPRAIGWWKKGLECQAQILWVEFKKLTKNGKPTKAAPHQRSWHTLERKRGALVLVAGEDFPASIEGFREWYKNSGLMRSRIL